MALYLPRPMELKVKKALRAATLEGMAYGVFHGFGNNYITAFAVAIQTNNLQIGILCSLPGFIASLAQLFDNQLISLFKSRKAVILVFALCQGLMLIPMLMLAFFTTNQSWLLILFVIIYSIFGAVCAPAWGSIMADLVPDKLRGKYFSNRGSLSTATNIIAFMGAGLILKAAGKTDLNGFIFIFSIAIGARLISWLLLTRLYEVPLQDKPAAKAKPHEFVGHLLSTNLGKYMIFLFLMSFVVNIASPYFTVYQLRDLKFDYVTFAILETISSIVTVIALTHWGRAADKVGNWKMVRFSALCIPFVPLLWIFSKAPIYIGIIQAFSGFAWAGYNLCTVNYLYDATTPENRIKYLAYFNAGNGLCAGLGALIGGYLAPHMPYTFGNQILTLFVISGILRLIVALGFLRSIKEVRKVSQVSAVQMFHIMLGGRPVINMLSYRRHRNLFDHEPKQARKTRRFPLPRLTGSPKTPG
ncbi:MAG: MFS transporter [Chloroflexi bacterium]|nr:MFS transporter [Chloroflexota bacterium]